MTGQAGKESVRKGITAKYNFSSLTIAIKSIFYDLLNRDYFQEYYGYYCVDAGNVNGKAGIDISNFIFRKTRRQIKWPFEFDTFDEDTLFDIIELLHDTISFPLHGYFHEYADYENGYILNSEGIIQHLLTTRLNELTMAKIPSKTGEENKVDNMTTDDEKELFKIQKNLFNIANNFQIRHNNDSQKDNYSRSWMSWIFYLYLSSIHLLLRIRGKVHD